MEGFRIDLKTIWLGYALLILFNCHNVNIKLVLQQYFLGQNIVSFMIPKYNTTVLYNIIFFCNKLIFCSKNDKCKSKIDILLSNRTVSNQNYHSTDHFIN